MTVLRWLLVVVAGAAAAWLLLTGATLWALLTVARRDARAAKWTTEDDRRLREWADVTHSEGCFRWHHGCAIAEVERLRAEVAEHLLRADSLRAELARQQDENERLYGEIERWRDDYESQRERAGQSEQEVERLRAERGEATVTDNSGSYEVTFYPRDARTVLVAREVVEGCAALATEVHRLRAEIRQHVDYCPSIPDKWRDRYVDGERDE